MIASRELTIPPKIEILYVEQEIVADDTPAIQAVLKADAKRTNMLRREKELQVILDDEEKMDSMELEESDKLVQSVPFRVIPIDGRVQRVGEGNQLLGSSQRRAQSPKNSRRYVVQKVNHL